MIFFLKQKKNFENWLRIFKNDITGWFKKFFDEKSNLNYVKIKIKRSVVTS